MAKRKIILSAQNLQKEFVIKKKRPFQEQVSVKALTDISLDVYEGEALGIVGESGSGKTTLGQCMIGLQKITGGKVLFKGQDIFSMNRKQMQDFRKNVQIVFQDPYSSLNPKMTVYEILSEPLDNQIRCGNFDRKEKKERIHELMNLVGLNQEYLKRYPHEFSGGQRQRVGIARALACAPELIVCDEAVSALDVSVQAQIVNLLEEIKEKTGVSYLFISHDLSVVRHISDRVVVLYLGRIVEMADRDELFQNPIHPYTRLLLECVPVPDPDVKQMIETQEEMPGAIHNISRCPYAPRCKYANQDCYEKFPKLEEVREGHYCACNAADRLNGKWKSDHTGVSL